MIIWAAQRWTPSETAGVIALKGEEVFMCVSFRVSARGSMQKSEHEWEEGPYVVEGRLQRQNKLQKHIGKGHEGGEQDHLAILQKGRRFKAGIRG
jgi:hypothetical protein